MKKSTPSTRHPNMNSIASPSPADPRLEIAALAGEIADLKNQRRAAAVALDAALHAIRRQYAASLAALDTRIACRMEQARSWAETHPDLFAASRSLDLTRAVVGFRTGQPALKTVPGVSWTRAIKKLKALPWGRPFVRVKEEVNKQRLLLQRHELGPERLRQLGLRVNQQETFYVEPKLQPAEPSTRLAA